MLPLLKEHIRLGHAGIGQQKNTQISCCFFGFIMFLIQKFLIRFQILLQRVDIVIFLIQEIITDMTGKQFHIKALTSLDATGCIPTKKNPDINQINAQQ